MTPHPTRYSFPDRRRATTCALIALVAVCAHACVSAGGNPRALAIADADRQAKEALAAESNIDVARIPARSIAVLPFAVDAPDTLLQPLGYAMAEFLTTDLAQSDRLRLVDRLRTDAIVRELDLVDKGVVDPKGAPRVGKLVGARQLLIGGVTRAPEGDLVFTARMVDVISGTVTPLVAARAPLGRVIDAERALALRVVEQMNITLTPAQRIAIEQRQMPNAQALVAYGRGLQFEAKGDIPGALAAFEEASRLDATFAASRGQAAQAGAARTNRASSAASAVSRVASLQRVLDLSTEAINTTVPTKIPEAVDAPASSQIVVFLLTVRIF